MSTLEKHLEKSVAPQHLLLIGDTKAGKSDYVAQAAIDGHTVIYVDRDNGLSTLQYRLENNPEALKRVWYFNPDNMLEFMKDFVDSSIFRYSTKTRASFITKQMDPDEEIIEIIPSLIPATVVMSIDSVTSLAFNAVTEKAGKLGIDLMESDRYGREIYGATGYVMTQLMSKFQNVPFHTIFQAHAVAYERKEKPKGVVGSINEKDMIIKETKMVPVSTSGPHGATLGKYFNQIGWLSVNRVGARILDFTVRDDRIGGGTPGGIGDPRKEYSFAKLFGKGVIDAPVNPDRPWIRTMTGAEFMERQAAKQANRPTIGGLKKPS